MTKRKFKYMISVMLLGAETAARNMEANLEAFADDYPTWTTERLAKYFTDIAEMSKFVGVSSGKDLHEATQNLIKIEELAIADAMVIRNQMERGYINEKNRYNDLSQLLGIGKGWAKAARGNQKLMLDMMLTFDNNTTEAVITELTAHDVAPHRITSLKGYCKQLRELNVTQETLKSEAPVITAETTAQLNKIYDVAMDICKAGKTVFRKDPARKLLFSFTRLCAQQASGTKHKTEGDGNTPKP